MALRDRLVDPQSPDRRPRRAAYALPTLFTAGNIFLGYIAILRSFRGAMLAAAGVAGAADQFTYAAVAIGVAVFTDGLDGSIARLTRTTSDFGREMDSLADVISFGLAPAVLAVAWGVQFIEPALTPAIRGPIFNAAYFIAFLFLLCGAARLARFNIQKNPIPKNPGRPDRKYFVGLPIPAGAGLIAAVVYASNGEPIIWPPLAIAWLCLLLLLGFLMVSTWRYYSFKGISLNKAYSTLILVLLGALIYAIMNYGRVVLLVMAVAYVGSGIIIRIGGMIRRRLRPSPPHPSYPLDHPEHQVG
jgi:CDP-diacylglycerol---serine O-phosphatidyltransferase